MGSQTGPGHALYICLSCTMEQCLIGSCYFSANQQPAESGSRLDAAVGHGVKANIARSHPSHLDLTPEKDQRR